MSTTKNVSKLTIYFSIKNICKTFHTAKTTTNKHTISTGIKIYKFLYSISFFYNNSLENFMKISYFLSSLIKITSYCIISLSKKYWGLYYISVLAILATYDVLDI